MSDWSLHNLLSGLHDDIQQRLATVRRAFGHPGTKGDASEEVWLEMLQTYLPKRYSAATAHVVDSTGAFSEQIDVVVFDRQYSPFIFSYQGQTIIPAESVYAAFEAKQAVNAGQVAYAQGICSRGKPIAAFLRWRGRSPGCVGTDLASLVCERPPGEKNDPLRDLHPQELRRRARSGIQFAARAT